MKRCRRHCIGPADPYEQVRFEESLRKYEVCPHKKIKLRNFTQTPILDMALPQYRQALQDLGGKVIPGPGQLRVQAGVEEKGELKRVDEKYGGTILFGKQEQKEPQEESMPADAQIPEERVWEGSKVNCSELSDENQQNQISVSGREGEQAQPQKLQQCKAQSPEVEYKDSSLSQEKTLLQKAQEQSLLRRVDQTFMEEKAEEPPLVQIGEENPLAEMTEELSLGRRGEEIPSEGRLNIQGNIYISLRTLAKHREEGWSEGRLLDGLLKQRSYLSAERSEIANRLKHFLSHN